MSGRSVAATRRHFTYVLIRTSWTRSSARWSSPVSSLANRTSAAPLLWTNSSKVTSRDTSLRVGVTPTDAPTAGNVLPTRPAFRTPSGHPRSTGEPGAGSRPGVTLRHRPRTYLRRRPKGDRDASTTDDSVDRVRLVDVRPH